MIDRNMILKPTWMLLAGVLASGILVLRSGAQSPACPWRIDTVASFNAM